MDICDDHPFVSQKTQAPGKVSVQMPAEDWLCKKLSKLNLTVVESKAAIGYPVTRKWFEVCKKLSTKWRSG